VDVVGWVAKQTAIMNYEKQKQYLLELLELRNTSITCLRDRQKCGKRVETTPSVKNMFFQNEGISD
jgi:hypothetical protein